MFDGCQYLTIDGSIIIRDEINEAWSLGGCKLQCLCLLLGDAGQISWSESNDLAIANIVSCMQRHSHRRVRV